MDNPEEILYRLEEFSKLKPKDIPRELEEYLSFVAKTGDPVYQWSTIKSLLREKLINVTTELHESCPSMEIPPCPNVEIFNYEKMKNFILEKLDTFVAAPFTVQRICELLTCPRKEYNRIDKYMRALEKNILVVSTIEPGNRRAENGEGIVNGIESDHFRENQTSNDINVEDVEMEEAPLLKSNNVSEEHFQEESVKIPQTETVQPLEEEGENSLNLKTTDVTSYSTKIPEMGLFTSDETVRSENCLENENYVSVNSSLISKSPDITPYSSKIPDITLFASDEPLSPENCLENENYVSAASIPAQVQKRRNSIEPVEKNSEEISPEDSEQYQKIIATTETPSVENENLPETSTLSKNEDDINSSEKSSKTFQFENSVPSENIIIQPTTEDKNITAPIGEISFSPKTTEEVSDVKTDEKEEMVSLKDTSESEKLIETLNEEIEKEKGDSADCESLLQDDYTKILHCPTEEALFTPTETNTTANNFPSVEDQVHPKKESPLEKPSLEPEPEPNECNSDTLDKICEKITYSLEDLNEMKEENIIDKFLVSDNSDKDDQTIPNEMIEDNFKQNASDTESKSENQNILREESNLTDMYLIKYTQ